MTASVPTEETRSADGSSSSIGRSFFPRGVYILPVILVVLSLLLEGAAWGGWLPVKNGSSGKIVFSIMEMVILLLLLSNGWRIRGCVNSIRTDSDTILKLKRVSDLVFASLALCILGDAVNRNFTQTYFAYDTAIEHSYLVDSIWFFFPGYVLYIAAAWRATAGRVPLFSRWSVPVLAAIAGGISIAGLMLPGMSIYTMIATGCYGVLIAEMIPVALWIVIAWGRSAWYVAAGAALAAGADALIGHFWLFGTGQYPGIAYLNFMVYFISQALMQQLPLVFARRHYADSVPRSTALSNIYGGNS